MAPKGLNKKTTQIRTPLLCCLDHKHSEVVSQCVWLTASNSWRSRTIANLQSGTLGDITRALREQVTISQELFRNDVLQNTLHSVAPNTQSHGVFYLEHTGSFIIHVASNVFRACVGSTTGERLSANLPTDWKGGVSFQSVADKGSRFSISYWYISNLTTQGGQYCREKVL